MPIDTRKLKSALLALALLAPVPASHAGTRPAADHSIASAEAFIQTMARGHFRRAEADFTNQMKQAAPPRKLRHLWTLLVRHGGPFQRTATTRTVHEEGYTVVIVRTDFKKRPIGLAVAFDSARRIAGLHLVPPPGARH